MIQYPLPFGTSPSYLPEDFIDASSNAAARSWLARSANWSASRLILWGPADSGKTHLLQIWARTHDAILLDGRKLTTAPTPSTRPLAIDAADQATEEALLHTLNQAAEAGSPVLLTVRLPPTRQHIVLADLASRLRASQTVEITAPEDELLTALLTRLAAERQLLLGADVQKYLLSHLARTPAALHTAITQLDHAALAGNRKITRAFAAALLAARPPAAK